MKLARLLLPALAGSLLATAAGAAPEGALRFEEVFADAPVSLHYRAEYQARGASHRLEAWMDGGVRLKRVTDGQVASYAERASPQEPEYSLTVLDLQRRISTRIDRSNLFRIGSFTDWFELAHALRHPRAGYELARTAAPAGAARPVAACDWYQLTQEGRSSRVCWSQAAALPLVIVSEEGQEVWRVTQLQRGTVPAAVFEVHDADFVRNDANGDIERD